MTKRVVEDDALVPALMDFAPTAEGHEVQRGRFLTALPAATLVGWLRVGGPTVP